MDSAQKEDNEKERLSVIDKLSFFKTPPDSIFSRIVGLTSRIFSVPVSGISVVFKDKVWYISQLGLSFGEIERDVSFDTRVIESDDLFIVENASADEAYLQNPLVIQEPRLKFYAGIPVKTNEKVKIGSFFVADKISRKLSDLETQTLKDLATWVEAEIFNVQIRMGVNISKSEHQETLDELTVKNRELEVERAKGSVMLESIGDGVIGINDKGDITFANHQTVSMLGFSQEELLGKPLIHSVKLVDGQDNEIPVSKRPMRNALYTRKRIFDSNYFYKRKDGKKFPVSITATPVLIAGKVVGGVNVFRDITKEKEIDKMKTEFISLASHQLRTPLSAMKWFSEMLIEGDAGQLNQEQQQLMENIYQSNQRMIDLVSTLLNISRIESGRIIVEPSPTDLKKLVDEVVLELQPRIEEKKHKLKVVVHDGLSSINIDAKLVRHVYMNLLSNAIKYTPDNGEITVTISKSGNEVISEVKDNGYGIPKHQQGRVFQKFFRGENIVKVVTQGTGLGLYLTKAIVDSSGGKIWYESNEGGGTTFWFILPLAGSQQKKGEVSLD